MRSEKSWKSYNLLNASNWDKVMRIINQDIVSKLIHVIITRLWNIMTFGKKEHVPWEKTSRLWFFIVVPSNVFIYLITTFGIVCTIYLESCLFLCLVQKEGILCRCFVNLWEFIVGGAFYETHCWQEGPN